LATAWVAQAIDRPRFGPRARSTAALGSLGRNAGAFSHKERPKGDRVINDAEMVARALEKWDTPEGGEVPRITHQLRLPAFKYEQLQRYTWPAFVAMTASHSIRPK
jgi:hypothetical protein